MTKYFSSSCSNEDCILPLNKTIVDILKEYLNYRKAESLDDYMFCNMYVEKLTKPCITNTLVRYNIKHGVNKRGIHGFRHTFAKKFIQQGGSVVVLQKILGHSSLSVTQNYINILTTDIKKEVDQFNILEEFNKKIIKIKK